MVSAKLKMSLIQAAGTPSAPGLRYKAVAEVFNQKGYSRGLRLLGTHRQESGLILRQGNRMHTNQAERPHTHIPASDLSAPAPSLPEGAEKQGESVAHVSTEASDASSHDSRLNIERNTRMMSMLVILSRVTGFVRTWAQVWAVGATVVASCYTLSSGLLNQLYVIVAGGVIVTGFMPVYIKVRKRGGQQAGNEYISNLMSIVGIGLVLVVVLAIVFAPQLVWLQSFEATDDFDSDLAVWFFRIFAIGFLFYPFSGIFTGINNADREYFWSNVAPSLNNLVVSLSFGIYAALVSINQEAALVVLAVGNVLGVVLQAGVQVIPAIRRGVRLRFKVNLRDPDLKDTLSIGLAMLAVTVTIFVASSVQTSYGLSTTVAASSIMYYAQVWFALPYSVFSVPVSTAFYTEIAEGYAKGDYASFRRYLTEGTNSIGFYLIPCTFLLIVFSVPLAGILGGSMGTDEIALTATYLAWLAPSLTLWGFASYLQRASSAMGRMTFFSVAAVAGGIGQVLICVLFTPIFGLPAVAFSGLVYQGTLVVVTFVVMRKRLGHIGAKSMIRGQLQALVAGVAGAVVGGIILMFIGGFDPAAGTLRSILTCVIAGVPALAVVVMVGALLKNATALQIAENVMRRGRRA